MTQWRFHPAKGVVRTSVLQSTTRPGGGIFFAQAEGKLSAHEIVEDCIDQLVTVVVRRHHTSARVAMDHRGEHHLLTEDRSTLTASSILSACTAP
jgi:hypothetical protein